jgi:class 3 adenylate cyclase/predicted ATPase
MDLGSWLRGIGLERYEQTLRDNAIDAGVLHDLTDGDLRELGIPIGARIKLLRAIVALDAGAETIAAVASPGPRVDAAERRQVTVMFADLVGWTALSARMDPEDLVELISGYQRCAAETIRRGDGFVARCMGDGVLAYFGYPRAHEDDAERAVRTGLALVEAVAQIETAATPSLRVRVGIATGLVVVGDSIESGDAQERGIFGETPNLAARLRDIADPNMVVLADSTRRLLGDLFELQDLGTKHLKGIAGSARAFAALRESTVASRFEALHASDLSALVGREEESELLLRRWSRARAGEGQVVLLSGEPGIGKSRLTAALLQRLAPEPYARLRYFCSPQHTESALHPIIDQMQRVAGLARDDPPRAKLDKLDAMLAATSTSTEDAALLAGLLSLADEGRYPALDLAPQLRRQRTLAALVSQVEALSRGTPVLMIFEDAHWTDPTSLELLGMVVDGVQSLRAMMIVTFRPDFKPPWVGRPHVTVLTISRLPRREVGAIIDRIAGNKHLPEGVRQDIIERADGVPLFVEEMTKAVLEAEGEGEARRSAAAVPASLHASLMARLDRLGPAKEVAQIGAAIGREFSHAVIAAVARKPQPELAAALDRLIAAGLLFRRGVAPDATYLFNHHLVQDAAYGTLLREPRRALHARIAEILERRFAETAGSQPELLAHHCTQAGLIEQAARFWGKAGRQSLDRSASAEAAEQLGRALGQIAQLPSTAALRREQITLQVGLVNALIHTKGYGASETRTSLDQARSLIEHAHELGEDSDDPLVLFSILWGFWVSSYMAFNGDVVRDHAAQFLALAESRGSKVPVMIGHRLMGISLLHTGHVAEGRAQLERAMALYDPTQHRTLATRFGQDAGVSILSWRSLALWLLGHPDAALACSDRVLKDAREIGQAATLMYALSGTSLTLIHCGDYTAANMHLDELVALADKKGALFWKAVGTMRQGLLLALTGKPADAARMITSAIAALRSTGATVLMPWYLSFLARAFAELEQFDEAGRCIREALSAVESTNEKWHEAEIQRVAGEIALISAKPDAAKAETYFDRAIAIAREQQTRSWELRAAISLARLKRDRGEPLEARDALAPVYGWFAEGFDTLDLREAKALLQELAS